MSSARIVTEVLSDLGLLTVSLSYWLPPVQALLGTAAPLLFCLALAAFLVQLTATLQRQFPDPELPTRYNVAAFLSGTILVAAFSAPLLYWGFSAVVLHRYAAT